MPGYLVKTDNFVAEIANDEELLRLAEVGTIQKGTRIRTLPDKTWREAREMPLLRKVWRDSSIAPHIDTDDSMPHSETVVDAVAPHFAFDSSSSTDVESVERSKEESSEQHKEESTERQGDAWLPGDISIEISSISQEIATTSREANAAVSADTDGNVEVTRAILVDADQEAALDAAQEDEACAFVRDLHASPDAKRDDSAQNLDMMDGIVCVDQDDEQDEASAPSEHKEAAAPSEHKEAAAPSEHEEANEPPKSAPRTVSEILDAVIDEHDFMTGDLGSRDTSIVDMARVCRPRSSRDCLPAILSAPLDLSSPLDDDSSNVYELEATKVISTEDIEEQDTTTHNYRTRTQSGMPTATNRSRTDAEIQSAITSDHEVIAEKPAERITLEIPQTSREAPAHRAASIIGAIEARHTETLHDTLHALKKDALDDPYEDNPSDVFRFRNRRELLKTLAREGEKDSAHDTDEDISDASRLKVRNSRELRRLLADTNKDDEPSASGRLRIRNGKDVRRMFEDSGDEDMSEASRLKVRGRSELRHLLATEEKAARDKSPIAATVSTVDYGQPTSAELRNLFEREDELHLLIETEQPEATRIDPKPEPPKDAKSPEESPEQESKKDDGPFSSVAECVAAPPSDPITAALPLRVDSVTHAPKQSRTEITQRTKAPEAPNLTHGPQTSTGFSHQFFDRALHDDEDPVACHDPLYLTNQRLWLIHFQAGEVVDYESYDVENIHTVGLHEEKRWSFLLLDAMFICAMALLWIFLGADVLFPGNDIMFLSLMGLGIVLIPILYHFSYRITVQFGYAGNIIRTTVGRQKNKRSGIMEFLARLDSVRHARRRANGAKP